jgi:hypothetical protein
MYDCMLPPSNSSSDGNLSAIVIGDTGCDRSKGEGTVGPARKSKAPVLF